MNRWWVRPALLASVMTWFSGVMLLVALYMVGYADDLTPDYCFARADHYEPQLGWLLVDVPLYGALLAAFMFLWRRGNGMSRGYAIGTVVLAVLAVFEAWSAVRSLWMC